MEWAIPWFRLKSPRSAINIEFSFQALTCIQRLGFLRQEYRSGIYSHTLNFVCKSVSCLLLFTIVYVHDIYT